MHDEFDGFENNKKIAVKHMRNSLSYLNSCYKNKGVLGMAEGFGLRVPESIYYDNDFWRGLQLVFLINIASHAIIGCNHFGACNV